MKICFCLCCNVATCLVALSAGPVHGNETWQAWSISASRSPHEAPQHLCSFEWYKHVYVNAGSLNLPAKSSYAYSAPPGINSALTNCTGTLSGWTSDTLSFPFQCFPTIRHLANALYQKQASTHRSCWYLRIQTYVCVNPHSSLDCSRVLHVLSLGKPLKFYVQPPAKNDGITTGCPPRFVFFWLRSQ